MTIQEREAERTKVRKRRLSDVFHQKKLERIADIGRYPSGVYWTNTTVGTGYTYKKTDESRAKREYRGKYSSKLKKESSRRFRRGKYRFLVSGQKAIYQKTFDYWWELT
jgi:hypothetical protein